MCSILKSKAKREFLKRLFSNRRDRVIMTYSRGYSCPVLIFSVILHFFLENSSLFLLERVAPFDYNYFEKDLLFLLSKDLS